MDSEKQFEDGSPSRDGQNNLARWLEQILLEARQSASETSVQEVAAPQPELLPGSNYHLLFYQQIPDFVMAQLSGDAQATLRYATLLYHLAACRTCHEAYLEMYRALSAALDPNSPRPIWGQGTRTLAAIPHRMLSHLCQTLISQAEAELRQGRRDRKHTRAESAARSLLQLAIRISAHIAQSAVRRQALQDLVSVATLCEELSLPEEERPALHAYTPVSPTSAGMRSVRRSRTVRQAGMLPRQTNQESPAIYLQSHHLNGRIIQRGQVLELHLQDLDETLRGHHVVISVLLGSLLEPVRWRGGNPHAIHSTVPVDAAGTLITPLGETELDLSNVEEYNLLEAMFMLLEIRVLQEK
ncbi:MAG: hypothetical protein IMW89_02185 [Ktedonobacteraceae bacterium]|nr:hypothetical protein [Ktedonobacteraceae bacterium]